MENSKGTPTVSVILPTYNPGISIRDAVQSILCQKVDLELIVVDDGSSVDVCTLIGADANKVKMIKQENKGVAAARNRGIKEARGTYLAFLDDDDKWTQTALVERFKCLKKYPDAGGILSATLTYNASGQLTEKIEVKNLEKGQSKRLERWEYCKLQQKCGYFMTQGSLIKRDIVKSIGGFNEKLFFSEDQDFLFSIIHDYPIIFLQVPTFIRFRAKMTANPNNYSKIKHAQYSMLNKHKDHVKRKWSDFDSKFFWKFWDMATRQCLKIALKENDYQNAKRYAAELKHLWDMKNIVSKSLVYLNAGRLLKVADNILRRW